MKNINTIPVSILLGCLIVGGFYFLTQFSKQNSIERQQRYEIQTEQAREDSIKLGKRLCVGQAEDSAVELNKESCERGGYCVKGERMYLVAQYENAYKTCLQRSGLD